MQCKEIRWWCRDLNKRASLRKSRLCTEKPSTFKFNLKTLKWAERKLCLHLGMFNLILWCEAYGVDRDETKIGVSLHKRLWKEHAEGMFLIKEEWKELFFLRFK